MKSVAKNQQMSPFTARIKFWLALATIVALFSAQFALACSSHPADTPTAIPDPTVVPTVAPTATVPAPTATATVAPTATPTPAPAPASTDAAERIDVDDLIDRTYELAVMLAEDLSPRQSATDEELVAAQFLVDEMDAMGYTIQLQDFQVSDVRPYGRMEVFDNDDRDEGRRFGLLPFDIVKSGIVEGDVIFAGYGSEEDFSEVDATGKIALVQRSNISFNMKVQNATADGAIGIAVFDNRDDGYITPGTVRTPPEIVSGMIAKREGETIRDALEEGETVRAELLVYPAGAGQSRNVIAELNNDIHDDAVVLVGAHYDTTPWSPGANDNGSGVAAAMIIAEELADEELPFDLHFVFFGSEETGLHGSNYYAYDLTTAEIARIDAMINLDVVATGDLLAFGDGTLTELADDAADDLELDLEVTQPFEWGASDYAAFNQRNVPYIMLYADDFQYINNPADTLEHVDPIPLGNTVAIVLELIYDLAEAMQP